MTNNKKEIWKVVKFTLFSISAGVIQLGSFALLEIFIKTYWIAYLISLLLSILWNFTMNILSSVSFICYDTIDS